MLKSKKRILLFFVCLGPVSAADIRIVSDTGEAVEFGTAIIAEEKFKANFVDGKLSLPTLKPGKHTLRLTAPGFQATDAQLSLPLPRAYVVTMPLQTKRTQTIRLISHEEKHNVSRHQMQQHELKSVPATFGDSISALATLPGVNRPGGLFGPLIIRGAPDTSNRYFVDDIPVINPQHFGGFQSVLSNELIDDITLFSSGFSAYYGQALGAVIDIRTIEAIAKPTGTIQVGIISSNAFLAAPWSIFSPKLVAPAENASEDERKTYQDAKRKAELDTGFFSISGRVGYLSLLVPPIYKVITGKEIIAVPEYYDYQWKARWYLGDSLTPNGANRHAVSMFVFGSYDTFKLIRKLTDEEKKDRVEQGQDPAAGDLTVFNDISSHSQSLSYDYKPSENIKLRSLLFNTLIYSRFYREAPGRALGIIDVNTRPNITGLREIFDVRYDERKGRLRLGVDYQFFYFNSAGTTQQIKSTIPPGQADFNNPDNFDTINVTANGENHLLSAYAENRYEWNGFFVTPGVRTDHLSRSRETSFDYRGLAGYKFPWKTTLAVSGGYYSSFAQTNWYRFNQASRREARVVTADYLNSEKAIHRSLALEQEIGLGTLKVEGFVNNLYDIMQTTSSADQARGIFFANTGASYNRGVEVSFRKSLEENEDGFFGWVSYTYTRADVTRDNATYPFRFEQRHVIKTIGVIRWGKWELGARFEMFTGFPFTPVTGSTCLTCASGQTPAQYAPINSPELFSANYPLSHRLDLRLTRKATYTWGSFSWFIEFINVYNFEPLIRQTFNSNEPYSEGRNPRFRGPSTPINLIPNFGFEWKF